MKNDKTKMGVIRNLADSKKPEENTALYEVLKSLPKPTANMKLSAAQKKWWTWFGVEFVKTNKFSNVDLIHLQQASFWMDARCQAIQKINTKGYDGGLVQTFKGGATNVSGHVSIVEKADKHLDSVSAHFGLSIKDRKKLNEVSENPGQLDLFDELMGLKKTGNF